MDISELGLIDFIKSFSGSTWNKIGFIHRTKGLRIHEVTITQELVFYFYMLATSRKFPVKIFESKSESTNGNDLEILIEVDDRVIKMPCQAKIIHRSGAYGKLNYRVRGKLQIDLLLDYAKKVGGYPAYLFYNHYWRGNINKLEKLLVPSEELWGCTIGSAYSIKAEFLSSKKYNRPAFLDLHDSICKPFHLLAEAVSLADYSKKLKGMLGDFDVKKLKKYSLKEIQEDFNWVDLTPPPSLGYIPERELSIQSKATDKQQQETFNPRFRLMFSKENLNVSRLIYMD